MPLFKIGRKFEHFKAQKDYVPDFKKVALLSNPLNVKINSGLFD